MNFTLLTTAIAAGFAGVAGFGLAWQLQAGNITQLELDHAQQRIEIARANRVAAERATSAVAVAQNNAAGRAVVLRRDADGSRNAGNGLRIASTAAVRTATDDPATCNSIIAAYSAVATASSDFIERVARDADQCHSDLQLINEAWPK